MARPVKPIPEGFRSLTPYLCVRNAARAIEFYKKVFGAREIMRMEAPGGKIGHAELIIGDSKFMLSDEFPEMGGKSAQTIGGSPVGLYLYVEEVDKIVEAATKAGSKLNHPVKDQFYGDRSGSLTDPFGQEWHIATHIEDVGEDELRRRHEAMMKEQGKKKSAA